MKTKPFFTIVIPTLNEEKYLPFLLEDLTNQSFKDFEVINVDGNSDDNTIKNASKFNKKLSIKSYITKTRNVSHQRNMGIEKSKGAWIIFMDADNRLPKYFLDGIKYRLAKNPETELFTTWLTIDKDRSLNIQIEKIFNFGLELGRISGYEWSLGALIGVKKEILKNKDFWFDQNQKVGEDGFFVKKLSKNGYKFSIFRDPKYTYSVRRLDSEGTINVARTGAKVAINYFQGKDFSQNDFGYKMEGGASYSNREIFNIQSFIKKGTKKQLEQARKIFKNLTKLEF